jgi:hypothetical protein
MGKKDIGLEDLLTCKEHFHLVYTRSSSSTVTEELNSYTQDQTGANVNLEVISTSKLEGKEISM